METLKIVKLEVHIKIKHVKIVILSHSKVTWRPPLLDELTSFGQI